MPVKEALRWCDGRDGLPDGWPRGAKLSVSFELNRHSTTRYRRPYVAVWVEDADGFPVRTLVLWLQEGRGARWHRDLTRWYKQDQVRQLVDGTKLIGTVAVARKGSRPTCDD